MRSNVNFFLQVWSCSCSFRMDMAIDTDRHGEWHSKPVYTYLIYSVSKKLNLISDIMSDFILFCQRSRYQSQSDFVYHGYRTVTYAGRLFSCLGINYFFFVQESYSTVFIHAEESYSSLRALRDKMAPILSSNFFPFHPDQQES